MATRAERSAARRPALTREVVLQAGLDLADREGLEALTMRRLASELGVEAMTLYYHVGHKDALVDAIVDRVVGEFRPPPPDGGLWRDELRLAAISARDALARHSWACPLLMAPARVSETRLRWMEALLGRLRGAGFSPRTTHLAYHALDSHIIGSTLWAAGYAAGASDVPDLAATFQRSLDRESFPFLAEHIDVHLEPAAPDDPDSFTFGLDMLLDGLARMLAG